MVERPREVQALKEEIVEADVVCLSCWRQTLVSAKAM